MGNYADIWIFLWGSPSKTSWGYYADLRFQKTGHPVPIKNGISKTKSIGAVYQLPISTISLSRLSVHP